MLEIGCDDDALLTVHDIPFLSLSLSPALSITLLLLHLPLDGAPRSRDSRRAGPDDARGARVVVPVRSAGDQFKSFSEWSPGRDRHAARFRLAKVELVEQKAL